MAIEKQIDLLEGEGELELDALTDQPALMTEFDDGTIEFDYDALDEEGNLIDTKGVINYKREHFSNLAEDLDEHELHDIAQQVLDQYEGDKQSCAEHMEMLADGMNLLGTKLEETTEPFEGACAAHHPLILENSVKFQAKAMAALYPAKGPVKVQVLGKHTDEKQEQAERVSNHMNYQIRNQMEEYFPETERMLFNIPIVGSGFKKLYYNGHFDRPCSEYVPVDQFITNYHTTSLKTAMSFTHVIHRTYNDLKKDMVYGLYRDIEEVLESEGAFGDQGIIKEETDEILGLQPFTDDMVFTLYEHYCFLDLPGEFGHEDGIALPYVVTVDKETERVLSIRRGWKEDDETYERIVPFVHFPFVAGPGFYGLGYIHLLGNLQITLTSVMRSLVDSGQFANLQGGFIDKRLRMRGDDGPIKPGEFKEVESGGMPITQLIQPLTFKEPSQVLLQMYQFIEGRGQKFADSTEQVVADSTNYGPVGTTLALLEESTKFFSGIHKRLHHAQKQEFKILAALNYEYLDETESFDVVGDTFEISKEDYSGKIDISPESDPNLNSKAQKLTVSQAIYTAALQNPVIHDMYEVTKQYYLSMDIDNELVDKLLPPKEEPIPRDPITDLFKVQKGEPIQAFPGQDHDAHIQAKMAFLQDPNGGANPMMTQIVPLIQANIQEHILMKFKEDVAGTAASGQVQGSTEEQIVSMAAQRVSQQSQQLAELQAKGVDEARNKLADAEMIRVMNETRKQEADQNFKQSELSLQALKLELEKLKEDNKMLLAGVEQESKQTQETLGNIKDLLELALEEKRSAEAVQEPKIDTVNKEE